MLWNFLKQIQKTFSNVLSKLLERAITHLKIKQKILYFVIVKNTIFIFNALK